MGETEPDVLRRHLPRRARLDAFAEDVGVAPIAGTQPGRGHLRARGVAHAQDVVAELGRVAPAELLGTGAEQRLQANDAEAREFHVTDRRNIDAYKFRRLAFTVEIESESFQELRRERLKARFELGGRQRAQVVVTRGVRRFIGVGVFRADAREQRLDVGLNLDLTRVAGAEGNGRYRWTDFVRRDRRGAAHPHQQRDAY